MARIPQTFSAFLMLPFLAGVESKVSWLCLPLVWATGFPFPSPAWQECPEGRAVQQGSPSWVLARSRFPIGPELETRYYLWLFPKMLHSCSSSDEKHILKGMRLPLIIKSHLSGKIRLKNCSLWSFLLSFFLIPVLSRETLSWVPLPFCLVLWVTGQAVPHRDSSFLPLLGQLWRLDLECAGQEKSPFWDEGQGCSGQVLTPQCKHTPMNKANHCRHDKI